MHTQNINQVFITYISYNMINIIMIMDNKPKYLNSFLICNDLHVVFCKGKYQIRSDPQIWLTRKFTIQSNLIQIGSDPDESNRIALKIIIKRQTYSTINSQIINKLNPNHPQRHKSRQSSRPSNRLSRPLVNRMQITPPLNTDEVPGDNSQLKMKASTSKHRWSPRRQQSIKDESKNCL